MELVVISFLAGALTILAPCTLPLLPIVVGGTLDDAKQSFKPYIIAASLAGSIFIFSLLLRASTSLLGVPALIWQLISGGVILLLGIVYLLPAIWEQHASSLNSKSARLLGRAGRQEGIWRDIATGAALGPVFSSCSPTYAFILAAILPRSWLEGVINLGAYTLGLTAMLLVVALGGQALVGKLGWAANPRGWFKRIVGLIFILVGVAIIFGLDKDFQTMVIDKGWYAPIEQIEESLRN